MICTKCFRHNYNAICDFCGEKTIQPETGFYRELGELTGIKEDALRVMMINAVATAREIGKHTIELPFASVSATFTEETGKVDLSVFFVKRFDFKI